MLPLNRDAVDSLAPAAPGWVRDLRTRAVEVYEKLEMPTAVEEVWRYLDLDFDLSDFHVAQEPGPELEPDAEVNAALANAAGRAMVVDGTTIAIDGPGADVVFAAIGDAVESHEGLVRGAYLQGFAPDDDKFSAAHHAFGHDGVFLYVPSGRAIEEPFHIEVQATAPGSVSFPHLTIVVESNAQADVVVDMRSAPGAELLIVPQIEASVRDGARLRLTTLQALDRTASVVGRQRLTAGRDATVRFGEVGLGGSLSRLHLVVDLMGRGSSADIVGAYFGDEDQVLDYRYFMNHIGSNTTSDMFLKGAVEDRAESVFTGMIRIEETGQRTNAFQTNRNLVLSQGAKANTVPNLEILADDVRCGHGSTVGPLDEEQRYYLMSRGLDRDRADRLQVRGFFEEALGRLPQQAVADAVRGRVNAKFVAAQEAGRV